MEFLFCLYMYKSPYGSLTISSLVRDGSSTVLHGGGEDVGPFEGVPSLPSDGERFSVDTNLGKKRP